jgi:hypothetical protein
MRIDSSCLLPLFSLRDVQPWTQTMYPEWLFVIALSKNQLSRLWHFNKILSFQSEFTWKPALHPIVPFSAAQWTLLFYHYRHGEKPTTVISQWNISDIRRSFSKDQEFRGGEFHIPKVSPPPYPSGCHQISLRSFRYRYPNLYPSSPRLRGKEGFLFGPSVRSGTDDLGLILPLRPCSAWSDQNLSKTRRAVDAIW